MSSPLQVVGNTSIILFYDCHLYFRGIEKCKITGSQQSAVWDWFFNKTGQPCLNLTISLFYFKNKETVCELSTLATYALQESIYCGKIISLLHLW